MFFASLRLKACCLVCLFGASLSAAASGQIVRGRLTEDQTGGPIPGAMVVLIGASDEQIAAAFTNARGEYRLQAPRAGEYVIRVLRIGYEGWDSEPLRLVAGRIEQMPLSIPLRAVQLAEIEVEAEAGAQCWGSPAEGRRAAAIWGEVYKALTATRWTAGQRLYRYTTRIYNRELTATGSRVLQEQSQAQTAAFITPFRSRPPQELSERGYFEIGEEESRYFAPDASSMLSDAFVSDHCFSVGTRDEDGRRLVGLTFQPIPERFQPEVAGTLWLDEETAELLRLEYQYVNFTFDFDGRDRIGGQMDFERLPSGGWVIRDWRIRMPVLGLRHTQTRSEPEIVLRGLTEAGGEISEIVSPSGEQIFRAPVATLVGTVFDSTSGSFVGEADVRIQGTEYVVTTDEEGRFSLDVPLRGTYTAEAVSSIIDSLGTPATQVVELTPGSLTSLRLFVPTVRQAAVALCGEETLAPGERVLFGTVRNSGLTGPPVGGATVTIRWDTFAQGGSSMRTQTQDAIATTDGEGHYVACGVPAEAMLTIQAQLAERESRVVVGQFTPDGMQLDGQVFATERPIGRVDLSLIAADAFRGSVTGKVVANELGTGLAGATVVVPGMGTSVITDSAGVFTVDGLPPGRTVLQARSIGYSPVDLAVEVETDAVVTLADSALVLSAAPVTLPTVVATAQPGRRDLARFYERRRAGQGSFAVREEIEAWNPKEATDVLRRLPGIRIRVNQNFGKSKPPVVSALGVVVSEGDGAIDTRRWIIESTRSPAFGDGECPLQFYLDGIFLGNSFDIDLNNMLVTSQLEAVEAYVGVSQIPPEYAAGNSACGVIVFWTR